MKKHLAILTIFTLLLSACNNETKEAKKEEAPQQVEQVKTETVAENNSTEAKTEEGTETETAAEEESEYASFEKSMVEKYKGEGISNIMVAPYSKGVDIIFNVDSKDLDKNKLAEIAKDVVKELKNNFDYINKDLAVGCSFEYQPDPNENSEVVMTKDVK